MQTARVGVCALSNLSRLHQRIRLGTLVPNHHSWSNSSTMRDKHTPLAPVGAQLRAARGLLNISVAEVAERTRLAPNTIKRAERSEGPARITTANAAALVKLFEAAGVLFLPADASGGPGVRFSANATAASFTRRREERRSSGQEA